MVVPAPAPAGLDLARVRADFPALAQEIHGRPLVYLDNGATALKPQPVLDALMAYYTEFTANVHRGAHTLSGRATDRFESSRRTVARFIGAREDRECVFVRGTTEAINLVARAFLRPRLAAGDEILVTVMEHHSNLVPWHLVAREAGATVRGIPVADDGSLDLEDVERLFGPRTKMLAVTHVSNVLGTVNPIRELTRLAHAHDVPVLVDGAQAAPHLPIDVQHLDADFYALSGHKLYGPTGIGVLYGKAEILETMPPYQGGGGMIERVTIADTTFGDIPLRFEAGTPDIAGVVGLEAAIGYLEGLDLERVGAHEAELTRYARRALGGVAGLRLIGDAPGKLGVMSFVLDVAHAADVATILDRSGVAVRAGHHCAQPLMERFGVPATARASFGLFNTTDDVDRLVEGLELVRELFA